MRSNLCRIAEKSSFIYYILSENEKIRERIDESQNPYGLRIIHMKFEWTVWTDSLECWKTDANDCLN